MNDGSAREVAKCSGENVENGGTEADLAPRPSHLTGTSQFRACTQL